MSAADRLARRRAAQVFARTEHLTGAAVWRNLCQKFVRTALGAGPGAPSAKAAWAALEGSGKRRAWDRDNPPPAGVPVYFKLNTPYWHAALSAGNGAVWSTDIRRPGKVDKVSIVYLERAWHAKCVGWTTYCNGVRVW